MLYLLKGMNGRMRPLMMAAALCGLVAASPSWATLFQYELFDHPDGGEAPPVYGLRLDQSSSVVHTFSFQDANGASMVTMDFDTVTGIASISGSVRHIDGGNNFSGEVWNILAELHLDSSPYGSQSALEAALSNPGSGFGPLIFDSVSLALSLANGAQSNGYGGETTWEGKADASGNEFYLDWNHRTNLDVLTGNGWWMPTSVALPFAIQTAPPMRGGSQDFLFVARQKTVPEPTTLLLVSAGIAAGTIKRYRKTV